MLRLFKPSADATPHTPAADETLAGIVKDKCEAADPPISVDEVALFNWGTKEPKEVVRALVELIGCKEVDLADPGKCTLDPARGPGGGKILLPKVWKKDGLAFEKPHVLKVKQSLPATAISITKLDKWFLPSDETCDVAWAVEGLKARAMKIDMEVYASNYAKATASNSGEFVTYTYADLPDTPIIKQVVQTDSAERGSGAHGSWKGESEAADGVLKPRGAAKRYINAASSPYTVMLRYYKDEAHKKAILRVGSFWPRWSGAGGARAVVDASLTFKWTLKDCPAGLQGQFQIFDKDNVVVWRQALKPADCGNGDHQHDWSEGKALVSEAKMPYRVQIQVHTDKDKDPGMGLAAMHTEVRIFTHPEIGTHGADHEREPQVLAFAMAPVYSFNGTAPAEDSAKGRKLRLAAAGYHPGPIEDGEAQAPYVMAVKEFQRDHAEPKVSRLIGADTPARRLKADGAITAETITLIAAQAANRRPLFGTDARVDITNAAAVNTALNTKATQIIGWVDDRHNATTTDPAYAAYVLPNMGLEDYRAGSDGTGDGKQAADQKSICRPYLPIEVRIPLMSKASSLQAANPAAPTVTDAMRAALGPIRVDWTFRDLAPEYKVDTAEYTHSRVRSLRYLTTAIDTLKGAHGGKDAFNCPDTHGGLRGADYHKAPFGVDADSLMPWKAEADAGVSTMCSITHDDLGQDEARLYAPRLGTAGVYLRPSSIGGDGYQFRAQVSFRDMPTAATHPNWNVLRERYDDTKLPQAHTAPIRLWRKDAYRAHVQWAPAHHWGAYDVQNLKFYEPGMVHIVQEGDGASIRATAAYPGAAGVSSYKDLIAAFVTGGMGTNAKTDRYRPKSELLLTDDTIWPWSTAPHLGVQGVPATGTTLARYESAYQNQVRNDTWRRFREPLVYDLLGKLERDQGLLRGHLIGEFRASPPYWKELYYCSACNTDQILMEVAATGGTGVGEQCRAAVCTGTLESSIREDYRCDRCATTITASITRRLGNTACTTPCTGTMRQSAQVPASWIRRQFSGEATVETTYTCDNCARTNSVVESSAQGGLAGTACGQVCPRRGTMRAVAGTRTPQEIAGPRADLSLPSWGGPLGGLFLDTKEGPRTYWSHEVGHHKNLSHAGDVIDPANVPQHDQAANSVDAAVAADANAASQMWDRDCIMSYVNTEVGADRAYFCGKCLLKLRGWKVEGIADPAGNLAGP